MNALNAAKKALKLSLRKDYYKILGLNSSASDHDIKKAYRKMALLHHPDKQSGLSDAEKEVAEAKFKEIGEAYTILSDPRKKHLFDSGMDVNEPNQPHFDGMNMEELFSFFPQGSFGSREHSGFYHAHQGYNPFDGFK